MGTVTEASGKHARRIKNRNSLSIATHDKGQRKGSESPPWMCIMADTASPSMLEIIQEEARHALARFNATPIYDDKLRGIGCIRVTSFERHEPTLIIQVALKDTTLKIKTSHDTRYPYSFTTIWETDINQPNSITDFVNKLNEICLKLLPEYSCSNPTGPHIGRLWKRNLTAYSPDPEERKHPHWIICEAGVHPDPDYVSILTREPYTV